MVKTLPTGIAQGVTDIVARAQLIFERRPMPETTKRAPASNRWKSTASKRAAEKTESAESAESTETD